MQHDGVNQELMDQIQAKQKVRQDPKARNWDSQDKLLGIITAIMVLNIQTELNPIITNLQTVS